MIAWGSETRFVVGERRRPRRSIASLFPNFGGSAGAGAFVYLGLCRLLQLVVLLCRSERSKEFEILLLRHELAILRRQPRFDPWIGQFSRRECLDRLLIFSRRQLEHVQPEPPRAPLNRRD